MLIIVTRSRPEQGAVSVLSPLESTALPFPGMFPSGVRYRLPSYSLPFYHAAVFWNLRIPCPMALSSFPGLCKSLQTWGWGGAVNSFARCRKILSTRLRGAHELRWEEWNRREGWNTRWGWAASVSLFWHGHWKRRNVKCKPYVLSYQALSVKSRWMERILFIVGSKCLKYLDRWYPWSCKC